MAIVYIGMGIAAILVVYLLEEILWRVKDMHEILVRWDEEDDEAVASECPKPKEVA